MSDRKIDMTELANYIRIRPPEKEKLAELLIRAKFPCAPRVLHHE